VAGSPSSIFSAPTSFSADVSGLTAGVTYHYRAKAVGLFTVYGNDVTFTPVTAGTTGYSEITPGVPDPNNSITVSASGVGTMTMTLTVNITNNGQDYVVPVACTLWNAAGGTRYVDTVSCVIVQAPSQKTPATVTLGGALIASNHTQINNNSGVTGIVTVNTFKFGQGVYTVTITFTLRTTP
jgi:hypothetical protein